MNSSYRLIIRIVVFLCFSGTYAAYADKQRPDSTPGSGIYDNANLLSADQLAKIRAIIAKARENDLFTVNVVAETTQLHLTPYQRANELNDEFKAQWAEQFPDKPLAQEVDLSSVEGPIRSREKNPLPLTFYFVRASSQGAQLFAVGGMDVLTSELGTPDSSKIYNNAYRLFRTELENSDDPGQAFVKAIDFFIDAATASRANIYDDEKPVNDSTLLTVLLIILGLLFAAVLVFGLKKLGGKGREAIMESMWPKLPLHTRLGGRHSGGMTTTISWANPTEAEPTEAEPTEAAPTEAEPTEAAPTEAERPEEAGK